MKNKILIMNRYNAILARRMKNSRFFYGGTVLFSAAMVILIGTWLTIYEHNRFASNYNVGTSIILYYIMIIELLLLSTRFVSSTQILPSHISQFPISRSNCLHFYLAAIVFDRRTLIYLSLAVVLSVNFFRISTALGFVFLLNFISYYFLIEISIVLCLLILNKHFFSSKGVAPILASLALIVFQMLLLTGSLDVLTKIPVISWVGKSCLSFQNENYFEVFIYFTGFALLLSTVYIFARRNVKYLTNE